MGALGSVKVGLLLLAGCLPGPAREWKAYASKEGNFAVQFPDKPEPHLRETEVAGLPGKTRFQLLELEEEEILYAAAYADLPAEVAADKELLGRIGFANLAGIFAFKVEGKPGTAIAFRGHPGTQFHFTVAEHGNVVARVLLVKRRLYLLLAAAEEIDADTPEVKKFLDSFDFLAVPK